MLPYFKVAPRALDCLEGTERQGANYPLLDLPDGRSARLDAKMRIGPRDCLRSCTVLERLHLQSAHGQSELHHTDHTLVMAPSVCIHFGQQVYGF